MTVPDYTHLRELATRFDHTYVLPLLDRLEALEKVRADAEAAQSISDDQWRTILTRMGATPLDAADVLIRIG